MEKASSAFLDAVRKSMRSIRTTLGATTIDPILLTAAEKLQDEGDVRRQDTRAAILALSRDGTPIKANVRTTGHSRALVRQVIRGERADVFRRYPQSSTPTTCGSSVGREERRRTTRNRVSLLNGSIRRLAKLAPGLHPSASPR